MNNPSYSHQFISRRISLKQNISLSSPKMSSASTVQFGAGAGGPNGGQNASASNSQLSIQVGSPPKQGFLAREKSGTLNNNFNNTSMQTNGSQLEGIVTESDAGMHFITSNNQPYVNARHAAFLLDENSVIGSGGGGGGNSDYQQQSALNSSNPYSKEKRNLNAVMIGTQPLAGIGSNVTDKKHNWSSKSIQITQKMSNEIEDSESGSSTQFLSRKFLDVPTVASATSRSRYKIDAFSLGLRGLPAWVLESKNSLVEVNFSFNDFQSMPIELCQFVHLRSIKMDFNRITSIPEEIAFLKYLEELSLAHNLLPSLPHTLQNMSQLRILNVSSNRIASFGSEITGLLRLEALQIQNNYFTRLPSKLYTMNNLKELGLDWFKYVRPSICSVISFPDQGQIFMRLFEVCYSKASGKTNFYGGNVDMSSAKNMTGFVYFREFQLAFSEFPMDLSSIAFQASDQEDIGVLRAVLEDSPQLLNVTDAFGQSLLTTTLINNKWKSVQALIDFGVVPTQGGGSLGSALHIAVSKLNVDLVEVFLDRGSNPNCIDYEGNTPLHIILSIFSKDPQAAEQIADLLLKYKANPNATNNELWAPLHVAVRKNQRLAVQYAINWNFLKKEAVDMYLNFIDESQNNEDSERSSGSNQNDEREKEGGAAATATATATAALLEDKLKEDKYVLIEGDDTFPCMTQLKKQQSTLLNNQKSFITQSQHLMGNALNAAPAITGGAAAVSGLTQSKFNEADTNETDMNIYFDFDLPGGVNQWTQMHIASSQGNIPMLELLSEADASTFSLTRFSQTPRRVALQSLILFKVLRKHEQRWIDRNILSEVLSSNGYYQSWFDDTQKLGSTRRGVHHRKSMNGYDERGINDLREFIAESMKQKEQFLQEQNTIEAENTLSFEEAIFGYSMKVNLENNQAERPCNKEGLKANYDDDEIEDPDYSEASKSLTNGGSAGGRAVQASGTLKPQQITTKISVKDMACPTEDDQMSGIDEGFEVEEEENGQKQQQHLQNAITNLKVEEEEPNRLSTRATRFLANSMMKHFIQASCSGTNQQNKLQPSGQTVEDPDQQLDDDTVIYEDAGDQGDLFHEICSLGFEKSESELDRLVVRIMRKEAAMTSSLGMLLLVRMLHMRLANREMLFRCEKGTLPRNIHMFNEFLFSKLSSEEITKQLQSIPNLLKSILEKLIARVVPLPPIQEIPLVGSMTPYMQYNTIAITSRSNAKLWQLILNTRNTLLSLNQLSFFAEFSQKCNQTFKLEYPLAIQGTSGLTAKQGILAISGVASPPFPSQKSKPKDEKKGGAAQSKPISSSTMSFFTSEFSPSTLVDFENWQVSLYNNTLENTVLSPIGLHQVIGSPSFYYYQQQEQQKQRQIFEYEMQENLLKRKANKVALSAPTSNRQSVDRFQANPITTTTASTTRNHNPAQTPSTSHHLQKRDLNCEGGVISLKPADSQEDKKIPLNSIQNYKGQSKEGNVGARNSNNGRSGVENKLGVDRFSTNPEIRLPAPLLNIGSSTTRSVATRKEKLIASITGEENISDDEDQSTQLNTAADIVKSNSISLYSARDTTTNIFLESQMLKSADNNKALSASGSSIQKINEKRIEFSVFQRKA